jgi:hypothetical protein
MRRSIIVAALAAVSLAFVPSGVTAASASVSAPGDPAIGPGPGPVISHGTGPVPYVLPFTPPKTGDPLSSVCSAVFHNGDYRLGPADLPRQGHVGSELIGYRRSGDLPTVDDLLAQYYNSSTNAWIYPPDDGYVTANGVPLEWTQTLLPGQDIDRYGSEYGAFLAPEGLPYAARSIPPQSMDGTPAAGCNYHDYRVLKPFGVDAGPIAPWFGQPGFGLQYQLDASLIPGGPATVNVGWLVANGYLERLV